MEIRVIPVAHHHLAEVVPVAVAAVSAAVAVLEVAEVILVADAKAIYNLRTIYNFNLSKTIRL